MFNDFIWQTYLNAGGKDVARMFEANLSDEGYSESYADRIKELQTGYCPSKFVLDYTQKDLLELFSVLNEGGTLLDEGAYTIAAGLEALYNVICGNEKLSAQRVFNNFSGAVAYYTTFLAVELPELFVPYYFTWNFNVFEKIAKEFDIPLPPIPLKKNYEERFYYYGDICVSLYEFREKHNMSPYELCAFLYDFAPKYIGGIDSYIIKELPEPQIAFFIGGSKEDVFLSDQRDTITCWQCSSETRAGDMVVMYLKSPISAVDSVWRSVSEGFNDPFFYYYRCSYIAKPERIKRITQKQLEEDVVFRNMPIVRKNMQGINGVELKPSEYNHLMDIVKADALRLHFDIIGGDIEIVSEKDVERKLVKPLLAKLGYAETEYEEQLQIMVGNHNFKLIPDYTLLPKVTRLHHSAFAIIEVKHIIPNQRAMEDTCAQARSYAAQLKAKYSIIASKDKLWAYKPDDDYTDAVFSATWGELNQSDTFSKLFKLIGNRLK